MIFEEQISVFERIADFRCKNQGGSIANSLDVGSRLARIWPLYSTAVVLLGFGALAHRATLIAFGAVLLAVKKYLCKLCDMFY